MKLLAERQAGSWGGELDMCCFFQSACYIMMKVPFFFLFYVGYASLHDDIFLVLRIKKYAKKASSDFYKIDMVP